MNMPSASAVVVLEKQLLSSPREIATDDFRIRAFDFSTVDVAHWLSIHNRTMPNPKKGRVWTRQDFDREFSSVLKEYETDRQLSGNIWFASAVGDPSTPIGTISTQFKMKPNTDAQIAVINWLAVSTAFQRNGVASTLLRTAERACWDRGINRIELSTLATWVPAIAFYDDQGYIRRH